jgi:hypothetical protein
MPVAVRPGGSFTLHIEMTNEGFAAPVNPRPVFLVLEHAGQRDLIDLQQEPRLWTPGAVSVVGRIRVPSVAAAGDYRVALWLPDQADGLRNFPEYSLRLAAQGVWQASGGDNTLGTLQVTPDAPGDAVNDAQSWSLIAGN